MADFFTCISYSEKQESGEKLIEPMKKKVRLNFKPESTAGGISIGCFCVELLTFAICVMISVKNQGNAGVYLGFFGLFILFMIIAGIVAAVRGLKKKELAHKLCKRGLFLNILSALGMAAVYVCGIF